MSVARASPVSPSWRASASSARSTAERPADPEPHTSAISSAALRPAAPRAASRSRGRSADGISRIARRRSRSRSCRLRHGSAPGRRRTGSPRARTTEARRFLPPSGPGDATKATDEALSRRSPTTYLRVARGMAPSGRAGRDREMGEDQEDRVEGGVQPDRGPDRSALDEDRAERPRDRQSRREPDDEQPGDRRLEVRGLDPDDVGEREQQRRPDDGPARPDRPLPGGDANPRKTISSDDRGDDRADEQLEQQPARRARSAAAGSSARPGTARSAGGAEDRRHDDDRGRPGPPRSRGRRGRAD